MNNSELRGSRKDVFSESCVWWPGRNAFLSIFPSCRFMGKMDGKWEDKSSENMRSESCSLNLEAFILAKLEQDGIISLYG